VNFLAHVVVAGRVEGDSPAVALGAALPDLAGIGRFRFDPARLPPLVRRGVDCHHRTDAAFHADRRFLAGAAALRAACEAGGLAVGPSRAIGHAGWELLLDGVVSDRTAVADQFAAAMTDAAAVTAALAPDDRTNWTALADSVRNDQWWRRYDDPAFVADRLYGMVRSRPRLRFDAGDIPLVADLLAAAQPAVAGDADATIDAVTGRLRRAAAA
jgi:acyl carrier protein phosphodiesterase